MTATRFLVLAEETKAVPPPFAKKRPKEDEEDQIAAASGDVPPEDPAAEPAPEDLQSEEPVEPVTAEEEDLLDEGDVVDDGAPAAEDLDADVPADPMDPEAVAQHEWAGDVIDEAVEPVTTPEESYSVFTGQEGEEAWLDKAPDGTLTGWVRDADGTVYRYSDADAWAVDVDDAGMARDDGGMDDDEDMLDDDAMADEELDDDLAGQVPFDKVTGKQLIASLALDPDLL